MRRVQSFEFFDLSWVPSSWCHFGAEYLATVEAKARGPIKALSVPIARAVEHSLMDAHGRRQVVDLCSGAAGPWPILLEFVPDVTVTLTDLRPNAPAYKRAAGIHPSLGYHTQPVNALDVPNTLMGCRTLINGFHHFEEREARSILDSAMRAEQPLAVIEMLSRSWLHILTSPFIVLIVLLLTPFVRPFSLARLFWTYLIPVLPIMIWWDGLISGLRVYSKEELQLLVDGLDTMDGYRWEIGEVQAGPSRVPYLLGIPQRAAR